MEYANNHHAALSKPTKLKDYITNIGEITSDSIIKSFGEYIRKHAGDMVIQGTVLVFGPSDIHEHSDAYVRLYSLTTDEWVNNILRDLSDIPLASSYSAKKKNFLKIESWPLSIDKYWCNPFK